MSIYDRGGIYDDLFEENVIKEKVFVQKIHLEWYIEIEKNIKYGLLILKRHQCICFRTGKSLTIIFPYRKVSGDDIFV